MSLGYSLGSFIAQQLAIYQYTESGIIAILRRFQGVLEVYGKTSKCIKNQLPLMTYSSLSDKDDLGEITY
jgi:hypothetical protein